MDDKEIVKKILAGNKEAFKFIVEKYMKLAYSIAYSIVGSREEALDVSQEAFIKVYKNLKKFDVNRPFLPWFIKILKNIAIDKIRKDKIKLIPLEVVENKGINKEIKLELERALANLNQEEREIIFLRHFDGYSYKEIAEILDIPIGTVMSRLFYARKKLKKMLEGRI